MNDESFLESMMGDTCGTNDFDVEDAWLSHFDHFDASN